MIRVRLNVFGTRGKSLKKELAELGILLDDDADLVLSVVPPNSRWLMGSTTDKEKEYIKTDDILYIETLAQDVVAHTTNGEYKISERLNRLEGLLPSTFLRISNSIIISTDKVTAIKPSLFSKFTLRLVDGSEVDVTRSYYQVFKNRFGI